MQSNQGQLFSVGPLKNGSLVSSVKHDAVHKRMLVYKIQTQIKQYLTNSHYHHVIYFVEDKPAVSTLWRFSKPITSKTLPFCRNGVQQFMTKWWNMDYRKCHTFQILCVKHQQSKLNANCSECMRNHSWRNLLAASWGWNGETSGTSKKLSIMSVAYSTNMSW